MAVASLAIGTATATDVEPTYELTFGSSASESKLILQLAENYYIRTQYSDANSYFVGLSTNGDPNSNRPSDANEPNKTVDDSGNCTLTVTPTEAKPNTKVYNWITLNSNASGSAANAKPGETTFTVAYDGENSHVDVVNANAADSYVTMTGNVFDWSKVERLNNAALTNVTLEIKTGTMAAKDWISNYTVASGTTLNNLSAVADSLAGGGRVNLNLQELVIDNIIKSSSNAYIANDAAHGYYSLADGIIIANRAEGTSLTFYVDDTDMTSYVSCTESGQYIYSDGNDYTTSIYGITSEHTEAVEYNGSTGATKDATGILLENGTTVKLTTNQLSPLTDGIIINAGTDGKATVEVANKVSQTYESIKENVAVLSGSWVLGISGEGTIVTSNNTGGTGFHSGKVAISNGGTLELTNYDALGYDGGETAEISIQNGTLALAGRVTFSTDITMLGGAKISTATYKSGNSTASSNNVPMIQVHNNLVWDVSGKNNQVEEGVKIRFNKDLAINVQEGGELTVAATSENGGKFTKTGAGTLAWTAASSRTGETHINGGTLKTSSETALGTGKVVIDNGGDLELASDLKVSNLELKNGTITFGSGSTLSVENAITLDANAIKLAKGISFGSAVDVQLIAATGITASNVETWTGGSFDIGGKSYTTTLDNRGTGLWIVFSAADEASSLTVDSASLNGTVLTLTINADLAGMSSVDLVLSDSALKDIQGIVADNVSITLVDMNNVEYSTIGEAPINVSFYNGAYVGNGAGLYNVQYIPEPATATLSLLALAGLAARRRRASR